MKYPPITHPLALTLAQHGFDVAARFLMLSWIPDIERAIRSWDDYPENMDGYPSQLTRKPEWITR